MSDGALGTSSVELRRLSSSCCSCCSCCSTTLSTAWEASSCCSSFLAEAKNCFASSLISRISACRVMESSLRARSSRAGCLPSPARASICDGTTGTAADVPGACRWGPAQSCKLLHYCRAARCSARSHDGGPARAKAARCCRELRVPLQGAASPTSAMREGARTPRLSSSVCGLEPWRELAKISPKKTTDKQPA